MAMYSPERGEIAKPSELYNSVRTVMSVLQGLESYGQYQELVCSFALAACLLQSIYVYFVRVFCHNFNDLLLVVACTVSVDMSRVFNNVLPQQTQPTDSFSGEKTLTTIYTSWSVATTPYLSYIFNAIVVAVGIGCQCDSLCMM
jgi:NCK-associated protein 1